MPVDMKAVIAGKFAQMAQTRPIDRITVKDLVEQCGISRQTFYYHFQDLQEVMEWSIRQMFHQALEQGLSTRDPEEAIAAFVRAVSENRRLLRRLVESQRRSQLEQIFTGAMRAWIRRELEQRRPELTISLPDLEVALNFYAYGIAGAVFESFRNEEPDVKKLSHQLMRLLSGQMLCVTASPDSE